MSNGKRVDETEAFIELTTGYNMAREEAGDCIQLARMIAARKKTVDPVCYITPSEDGFLSNPISRETAELTAGVNPIKYFSIL